MKKAPKKIPGFKTEAAERKFWESNDCAEFLNWSVAQKVTLSNLKQNTNPKNRGDKTPVR